MGDGVRPSRSRDPFSGEDHRQTIAMRTTNQKSTWMLLLLLLLLFMGPCLAETPVSSEQPDPAVHCSYSPEDDTLRCSAELSGFRQLSLEVNRGQEPIAKDGVGGVNNGPAFSLNIPSSTHNLVILCLTRQQEDMGGAPSGLALRPHLFRSLQKLERLEIIDCNVSQIPASTFAGLGSLSVLRLQNNLIRESSDVLHQDRSSPFMALEDGALDTGLAANNNDTSPQQEPLDKLAVLILSNSRLAELRPNIFRRSRNLKELQLQDNFLRSLPSQVFEDLQFLQVLNLSRNSLFAGSSSSDDATPFRSLIRLIALDLSHNLIDSLGAETFRDLSSLQILDLSNNRLKTLGDGVWRGQHNLHILRLSHNHLKNIEVRSLEGLEVLHSLSLDHNDFEAAVDWDQAFRHTPSLKDLRLGGNRLTALPKGLKRLTKLTLLDMSHNAISSICHRDPATTPADLSIKALDLKGNSIVELQSRCFRYVGALELLDLANNDIRKVHQGSFKDLGSLKVLRLEGNSLEDLNGLLSDQKELRLLNVSFNRLRWFDYGFFPMSLETLDVSFNEVEELGNYFQLDRGFNLTTLDAGHNRIRKIGSVSLISSLRTALLNSNQISSVEVGTFRGKFRLESVDFSSNFLEVLPASVLWEARISSPRVRFLIGLNPYQCSCGMEWLANKSAVGLEGLVGDLDKVSCTPVGLGPTARAPAVPVKGLGSADFRCKYKAHCFALCLCCDFFACDCRMRCPEGCRCFRDSAWSLNVIDCSEANHTQVPSLIPMDATQIRLDGNAALGGGTLPSQAFIGRKMVTSLFLNGSRIRAIDPGSLSPMDRLEELHLEDNLLARLEGHEFLNLSRLEDLYLSGNRLSHIDAKAFSPLRSLRRLRLHDNNLLASFGHWELPATSVEPPSPISVTIRGNGHHGQEGCFCQESAGWTFEDVRCNLTDTVGAASGCSRRALEEAPGGWDWGPGPSSVLLVSACTVSVVGGLMVVVGLALCRKVFGGSQRELPMLYDAFISYALEDQDFVHGVLAPHLEDIPQSDDSTIMLPFKLGLQHEDKGGGTPGRRDLLLLQTGWSLSKRHILIVTPAYLASEWPLVKPLVMNRCGRVAGSRRRPCVVVLEEPLDSDSGALKEYRRLLEASGGRVFRFSDEDEDFFERLKVHILQGGGGPGGQRKRDGRTKVRHHRHHHRPHHQPSLVWNYYCPDGVAGRPSVVSNLDASSSSNASPDLSALLLRPPSSGFGTKGHRDPFRRQIIQNRRGSCCRPDVADGGPFLANNPLESLFPSLDLLADADDEVRPHTYEVPSGENLYNSLDPPGPAGIFGDFVPNSRFK